MSDLLITILQWGPPHGPHTPMGPHSGAGGVMGPWLPAGDAAGGYTWPVLLLALAAIVVLLALFRTDTGSTERDTDRAMGVLREAYARGELTDEAFERRAARLAEPTDAD